jgi:hypothetical protein
VVNTLHDHANIAGIAGLVYIAGPTHIPASVVPALLVVTVGCAARIIEADLPVGAAGAGALCVDAVANARSVAGLVDSTGAAHIPTAIIATFLILTIGKAAGVVVTNLPIAAAHALTVYIGALAPPRSTACLVGAASATLASASVITALLARAVRRATCVGEAYL